MLLVSFLYHFTILTVHLALHLVFVTKVDTEEALFVLYANYNLHLALARKYLNLPKHTSFHLCLMVFWREVTPAKLANDPAEVGVTL